MRGFLYGIATMIVIGALGVLCALLGFVNMRADNPPSKMETALAGHAMDASAALAAPKLTNPVKADEANLVAGARLYSDHCRAEDSDVFRLPLKQGRGVVPIL